MIYSSTLRRGTRFALTCAMVLGAVLAQADLKVVSKVTISTLQGPQIVTVVSFFKGSKVRIDNGDVRKISDSKTHKTILINMKKQIYMEPDTALALKDVAASIKKQRMKITAHVSPTGKRKMIAGRSAQQYVGDLTVSGDYPKVPGSRGEAKFKIDEWTTSAPGVNVSQSEMMGTVSELLHSLAGMGGMEQVTRELGKIKGVPLNTTMDGTMTIIAANGGAPQSQKHTYVTEAVTVNEGPLPASVFEIPKGFKLVSGKKPPRQPKKK